MGEQIAGGRVAAMLMIAADMEEIRKLVGLVEELKRHLEGEKQARFNILAKLDADVAELEEEIENAQTILTEISERLDRTLAELYQAAPAEPVKEKKNKKGALAAATEAVKNFGEAMAGLGEAVKTAEDLGLVVEEQPAGEVVNSTGPIEGIEEIHGKMAAENERRDGICDDWGNCDLSGKCFDQKGAQSCLRDEIKLKDGKTRLNFEPLAEKLGECELCQGWGVIDGELYGEFALVPCTCEAGKKVQAGGDPQDENQAADVQVEVCPGARACADYAGFMANPGQQYPPPAALAGIPCYLCGRQRPANCTGCPYRFECELDPETLDCREVQAGTEEMKALAINGPMPQPEEDIDEGWPDPPGAGDNQTEPEKVVTTAAPEPSPLQLKCPHPKPFRKEVEGVGIVCEVCKLTLEPITVTDSALEEKHPDCCKPMRRRSDVDKVTGNRVLSCMDCGKIHRIQDKDGKNLPLDSQGVPWKEDGPDMAPEARGDKARSKKKTTAQE